MICVVVVLFVARLSCETEAGNVGPSGETDLLTFTRALLSISNSSVGCRLHWSSSWLQYFHCFSLSRPAEVPSTFPFWELLWVLQCFSLPKHFTCSHHNLNDSAGTNHTVLHCALLRSCEWTWPEVSSIMDMNVFMVPIHKSKLII